MRARWAAVTLAASALTAAHPLAARQRQGHAWPATATSWSPLPGAGRAGGRAGAVRVRGRAGRPRRAARPAIPRCCSTPRPSRQPPGRRPAPARAAAHSGRRHRRRRRAHRCSPASAFRGGGAGQRPFHRARDARVIPNRSAIALGQLGAAQRRVGVAAAPRANATTSSVSLCARRGPGPGRDQRRPARRRRRRRPPGRTTAGRTRTPPPRGSPAAPSTRTRRTISYLTCTRSRASKNSEPAANASSATASGRGFRQRACPQRLHLRICPAVAPCRLLRITRM